MHRKVDLCILIILIASIAGVRAEMANDSLFSEASELYADGDFQGAADRYEQIVAGNQESAELYFNLGNSYYKMNEYALAIVNYERALLLDPGDEDILFNLEKARFHNLDNIEEIPQFAMKRWIKSLIILLHSNTWAIISLSAFALALGLITLYLMGTRIRLRRIGFYGGIFVLFISIGALFFSYKSRQQIIHNNSAIITTPTVTVKSSPRDTGTDLFIIHEGTKVFIQNAIDEWYEVELSDGKQGWLKKSDVEVI